VIGIIIERWWLTGVDARLPEFEGWEMTGIDCVIETIFSINEQTEKKDFSCIAIGTDFDGFTDTPPDLYLYEQFGNLLERLREHLTEDQIKMIFSENAMRMLELGWKTL
jgi:microsomal dipeptidase-like Zn-dependent dipeptidase